MAEDDKPLSAKAVEEYHKSGGEVKPEIAEEKKPEGDGKPDTLALDAKPDTEAKPDDKTTKPDPHAENHRIALKETREQFKQAKTQWDTERRANEERLAALEKKHNEFIAQLTAKPEPTLDQPIDYFEHKSKKLETELGELKTWKQQQEAAQQQTQQLSNFRNSVANAAKPFIDQTPDYNDAYNHVMAVKEQEMRLAGIPDDQIPSNMGIWEAQFAAQSMKAGKNPGESLYAYAKALNFQPKQPGKPAASKLDTIERGQDASKTLGGGGDTVSELSLEALERMSDEQIKQLAKDPKKWLKMAKGI